MPGSATSMRRAVGPELLAQLARVDAQVVRLGVVARPPHLVEQRAVREDPPGVAGQRREHGELLGREVEVRAGERGLVAGDVHPEVAAGEHRVLGLLVAPRSAQRHAHPASSSGIENGLVT